MAKIVRYKLRSPASNDETFQVTRMVRTITTSVAETTQEVDDNGAIISGRIPGTGDINNFVPEMTNTQEIKEGIKAIGLPSGAVAQVTVLETTDGLTEAGIMESQDTGRNPVVDLTQFLHADRVDRI